MSEKASNWFIVIGALVFGLGLGWMWPPLALLWFGGNGVYIGYYWHQVRAVERMEKQHRLRSPGLRRAGRIMPSEQKPGDLKAALAWGRSYNERMEQNGDAVND